MLIEIYNESFKNQWNDFVSKSKNGLFLFYRDFMEYHSDRFADFSLLIFNKEKLISILPANVDNNILYSHGGLTFGGFVTNEKMSAELMSKVFHEVILFLKKNSIIKMIYKAVPYIFHKIPSQEDLYSLILNDAVLLRRDISSVIDLSTKIRYSKGRKWGINKAKKYNIQLKESSDYLQFITILKTTLQKYKSKPVHSKEELLLLSARLPDHIKLFGAFVEGRMVAGTLIFIYNRTIHTQYMASTTEGKKICALDLLMDHLIKNVFLNMKYFSFGISTEQNGKYLNRGLIAQKEGFGARAVTHDFYELKIK